MNQITEDRDQKTECCCITQFITSQSAIRTSQSAIRNPQSAFRIPQSHLGFTLIELIVVIIIVVVLAAAFLDRMLYYVEQAEKTAMVEVANSIQSALIMQYGQLLTRGQPSDLPALAKDNPMNWLQKIPNNYAGEFYDPDPQAVERGNWMYDLKSRDLIYVLRNTNYFKPGKDGKKWIRFHVAAHYETSRLPSLQHLPAELTGILFEPTEPYVWF